MKSRKVLLLVLFIFCVGLLYYFFHRNTGKQTQNNESSSNSSGQSIGIYQENNLPGICISQCNSASDSPKGNVTPTKPTQAVNPVATTQQSNADSSSCSDLYSTYYTIPMKGIGTPPTSTYLIHYIGTNDYDYQVYLYNLKVTQYNNEWQMNMNNFLNKANNAGCSTALYISTMNLDKAYPYTAN